MRLLARSEPQQVLDRRGRPQAWMPDQTHRQLASLSDGVDTAPYALSFEDSVDYLARQVGYYDISVSYQNVVEIWRS